MRLRNTRRSRNVQDRRGRGGGAAAGGIGGVGLIVVLAIGYFTGVDVTALLEGAGGLGQTGQQQPGETRELTAAEQQSGDFAARVLTTTEEVWAGSSPNSWGRHIRRLNWCCSAK